MENQSESKRISRRAIAIEVNKRVYGPADESLTAEERKTFEDHMVEIVDTIFDAISDEIIKGNEVGIYGFGKFGKRTYGARKARNPKTGEAIDLGAFSTPYFRPSALLRKAVK